MNIHSASEPYNEEREISQDRLDSWLNHFEMSKFQSHCSGHATGEDMIEIISQISLKSLFPVHTENADLYSKVSESVGIVKDEIQYKI